MRRIADLPGRRINQSVDIDQMIASNRIHPSPRHLIVLPYAIRPFNNGDVGVLDDATNAVLWLVW